MKKKTFTYSFKNIEIAIEANVNFEGSIEIPVYRKYNDQILGFSFWPDEETFLEDLRSLLPESLEGDLFSHIQVALLKTVKKHIQQYGRIMDADLELYVSQEIMIIDAIAKQKENKIFTDEEKCSIHQNLKSQVLNSI